MILVDGNLLIYAAMDAFPEHERANAWLDSNLSGTASVAMPWQCLLSFLRITTNSRIIKNAMTVPESWQVVRDWIARPNVWIPTPGERHAEVLGDLLLRSGIKADLINDAHLAAIAIEHGLILCSADTDFARFRGLRWENPLK